MMENMSLFNQPDDLISSAQTSFIRSSKLDVVQMDFLEAHKFRDWIVMALDEAKKFYDIDFRDSFFSHLFR